MGRKCSVFGCRSSVGLHSFPQDLEIRRQWLRIIGLAENYELPARAGICNKHFASDSYANSMEIKLGFAKMYRLKSEAVPTLALQRVSQKRQPTLLPRDCRSESPPARGRKIKSFAYATRTVSTQLSAGTLQFKHYRSRGVQATIDSVSRGADTVNSTASNGARPPKRPRVEIKEEDDDVSFTILSQDISNEPTYEEAAADLSDLIDMESSCEFEDAKYIVFESALRELFENCPVCKRHCIVQQCRCGTFVAFSQVCPHCLFSRKWQSQPMKDKIPQGNLELSAAVYFNGGSFTQFEKICNAINLKVHQYDTFRRHAQNYLEPAIYHKWKLDQSKVLEEMKRKGKIAVSGDMRTDSPGNTAKFGSYTVMELADKKILDIQLVQRNEVGSSVKMETEGLRRSLDLLESNSVQVDHIVTDRHPKVQELLREKEMSHYYDFSHTVKGLSKKLEALARKKDCRLVKKWLPTIKKHMSWAVNSSATGSEKVAKWKSLVNHIQNVHEHDNPLFPKCVHPISTSTDGNEWLKPGSVVLNRVEKMLLNKRILEDVSKLSTNHQTSLESFHNMIPRFVPKSVNFQFTEMLCRLYLAAMHHNENMNREEAKTNAKPLWTLRFPLSAKGRPTAQLIKTGTTFGYRRELMHLVLSEVLVDPAKFQKELQKMAIPPTLTSQSDMLLKEDVEAVQISDFNPAEAGSHHNPLLYLGTPVESTQQDHNPDCDSKQFQTTLQQLPQL